MAMGIAMVLFEEDSPLSLEELARGLATLVPGSPPPSDPKHDEHAILFRWGDTDIVLGKMPAPIPWSDLEGPCATSILWPQATEEVRRHELHWIVTVMGEFTPLELSRRLTQVTAAVLQSSPAAQGVLWGNASLLVPKGLFVEFTREVLPHGPPVFIWIDFRVGQDSAQTCAGFTTGMQALGHMELEAREAPEPVGELRERLVGLATYLLENGPVIRDGDTIGEDAQERIRVTYSPSTFGHEGQVMRLIYEQSSPQKPWWKLW